MIKFTDANKWDDPWFEAIPPWAQLLWLFVCDKSDHVGVLAMSKAQADRRIPGIDWGSLETVFAGRMTQLGPDLWLLPKYLNFQQPNLAKNENMQKAVTKLLNKHGLQFDGRLVTKRKEGGEVTPWVAPPKPLQGSHVSVSVPVDVPVQVPVEVKPAKQANRDKLIKALRSHGMAWKDDAFSEWADMLQGRGGARNMDEVLWLVHRIAYTIKCVTYARQAMEHIDRLADELEQHREKNADVPKPTG